MSETRTEKEVQAAELKAAADAASAELDRQRKEQELEEWKSASALRARESAAKVRQVEQQNADGGRTALKDLVPDLTKVVAGTTTVPDSATMFDALLAGQALQRSATTLASKVWERPLFATGKTLLVTTDLDLAARDGQRHAIVELLGDLGARIDGHRARHRNLALVGAGAAAVAAIIPGLLSLMSPRNSVSLSSSTTDDTVAMLAVAGALAAVDGSRVVLDKARFVSANPGPVRTAWNGVHQAVADLQRDLEVERSSDAPDTEWLADGDQLLEACRTGLAVLTEIPSGASTSPLASAEMQDVLRSEEFAAILVVKGGAASATQLIEDRRFKSDKLTILSTASIAYVLIDHRDGCRVDLAGLVHGSRTFNSTIGSAGDLPTTAE